jgi:mannose-6-phosphate isomerase-like protein (cupin superfamily)
MRLQDIGQVENNEEDTMTFQVRRVVTGHNSDGRAVVKIDELTTNAMSKRSGNTSTLIWTTEGYPIDNSNDFDGSTGEVSTCKENGTVFRIVCYEPGVSPRNHRTNSIDYAVVLSGEIEMQLDDTVVHLKANDVLVQRGTIHNWVNRGKVPCVIAFVLISAQPVSVCGKALVAVG